MPRIFLDIDDVVFSWYEDYAKRFNTKVPKSWLNSNLIKKRLDILSEEKPFWIGLTVKNIPIKIHFYQLIFAKFKCIPFTLIYQMFRIILFIMICYFHK